MRRWPSARQSEHTRSPSASPELEPLRLHDLRTMFAPGIALVVSPPIVPVLESVASGACGRATSSVTNKQAALAMKAD